MTQEANIYLPLWNKYRPVIILMMKKALADSQSYQLTRHEFETLGERGKALYHFNIEIEDGKAVNDITGTAVARDLMIVLNSSPTAKVLMKGNKFKINMDSNFMIHVNCIFDNSRNKSS